MCKRWLPFWCSHWWERQPQMQDYGPGTQMWTRCIQSLSRIDLVYPLKSCQVNSSCDYSRTKFRTKLSPWSCLHCYPRSDPMDYSDEVSILAAAPPWTCERCNLIEWSIWPMSMIEFARLSPHPSACQFRTQLACFNILFYNSELPNSLVSKVLQSTLK